ncbi:hypothetical protein LUZ63_012191 [Rhynchospora breviuscula]|uniref:At1g61320/AtMIF1 LRR domain-containing protein n=1 Tax=Rhynchospora breviuscula TaxID=2022672 RepID=A0A9Q0CKF8_9POAL|nr:hypothetical protein LUZ63_012191 [Rhynchospora breviuscula]
MEVIIARKETKIQNSDRISNLPDPILIDILSILPDARNAAQTCILSKRWRNLWTFIPSLSFRFYDFTEREERFNNFVNSFLRLRDNASNVHKFDLYYSVPFITKFPGCLFWFWEWIMYAFDHKVKNLVLHFWGRPVQFFPKDRQFHCGTLEDMHLNGLFVINADHVCLPKLRKLSFVDVTWCRDSIEKLLSGCPALVILSMHHSKIHMNSITFGTIKSLTMESCTFGSLQSGCTISAPHVEYLELVGDCGYMIIFDDMTRVNKAIIIEPEWPERTTYNLDLIRAISGVQSLKLTSICLKELLDREWQNCHRFNHLKHLILGFCCQRWDFSTLYSFLKHCPNLENLCLLHEQILCEEEPCHKKNSEITQQYEGFMWPHLKVVKIDCRGPYQQSCMRQLEELALQWTKEIEGIQIILPLS